MVDPSFGYVPEYGGGSNELGVGVETTIDFRQDGKVQLDGVQSAFSEGRDERTKCFDLGGNRTELTGDMSFVTVVGGVGRAELKSISGHAQ